VTKKRKKGITTQEMEVAIANHIGFRVCIIVPNLSWGFDGMHECDIFYIRKSGYAVEVEIKRTKSDLLADFKKGHKHIDKQNRIAEFYYALPEDLLDKVYDLIPKNAGIIKCYKLPYGRIVRASTVRKAKRIPNARKLTKEEQLRVAHLGSMRIWKLKDKLNKIK
jgi:hypothetical protein